MKKIEFDVLNLMSHTIDRLAVTVPHLTIFYNIFSVSDKQNFYTAIWDYNEDLYNELKENNTISIYNINNDFMFIQIFNAVILNESVIYDIKDLNEKYAGRLKKYCIYHKTENSLARSLLNEYDMMSLNPYGIDNERYEQLKNAIMSIPKHEITNVWKPVTFSGSYEGLCATCSTVNIKENRISIEQYDLWRLTNHYFEDYISDSIDIIDLYRNSKKKIMSFGE